MRYDVRSIAAGGAIIVAATMIGWVFYTFFYELFR